MKSAYNIVSEARVAFEKACTDLGKAVKLRKGTISKKVYEELATKHLRIIHEVLVNSEANARALDKALEAYDAEELPVPEEERSPAGKGATTGKKTTKTPNPAQKGTTMDLSDQGRAAGYMPRKRSQCPNEHLVKSPCHGNKATLVTMTKGNSSIKACKCGYRKSQPFQPV